MSRCLMLLIFAGLLVAHLAGCGSHTASTTPAATHAATGATLAFTWPARARLIPRAAERIVVHISDAGGFDATQTATRPTGDSSSTSTITFPALPRGRVWVEITAYAASSTVPVASAQQWYDTTASGPLTFTIASTIDQLVLDMPSNTTALGVGITTRAGVRAIDNQNREVLLTPGQLRWATSSDAVAGIAAATPATSAATITTKTVGTTNLTVTDAESGKSTSVNVAIQQKTMTTPRVFFTATKLSDGRVLLAGGENRSGTTFNSLEIYDPATGLCTAVGSMLTGRYGFTATLLPDHRILFVGGLDHNSDCVANAEVYDPTTGQCRFAGALAVARGRHTTTLLSNGTVLVAGGTTFIDYIRQAEFYDPAGNTWTTTGALSFGKVGDATATLLPDGKVLFAGVNFSSEAVFYNPSDGSWATTGSMSIYRTAHTANLLPDGKVLVAGGFTGVSIIPLTSAEIYDSATGRWSSVGDMSYARYHHTATTLPDGHILIAAGYPANNGKSAELFVPGSNTFSRTGDLNTGRYLHTAVLLDTGQVLIAGGEDMNNNPLSSIELYDPASGTFK